MECCEDIFYCIHFVVMSFLSISVKGLYNICVQLTVIDWTGTFNNKKQIGIYNAWKMHENKMVVTKCRKVRNKFLIEMNIGSTAGNM